MPNTVILCYSQFWTKTFGIRVIIYSWDVTPANNKGFISLYKFSGQAAAYKIGEQRILQLRRKFEAKEGRAYDLVNNISQRLY
jgi:hypothetical protein